MEIDSIAVKGRVFRFGFVAPPDPIGADSVHATVIFRTYPTPVSDDRSHQILPVRRGAENMFFGEFIVPDSTASFSIVLCTDRTLMHETLSPEYLVMRRDGQPSMGVNLIQMSYSETGDYLEYFAAERELYPLNFDVFAGKWLFELENGILNLDEVKKDIARIEAGCTDEQTRCALLSIGYVLLNDTTGIREMASRLSSFVQTPVCNAEYAPMLLKVFERHPDDLLRLVANNPHSILTRQLLLRGDYMSLSPDVMLDVVRKRIADLGQVIDYYYLGRLLVAGYPDSLSLAVDAFERILSTYDTPAIIDRDKRKEVTLQIPNIYLYLGQALNGLGRFYDAERRMRAGLSYLNSSDMRAGLLYLQLAKTRKGLGDYTEAALRYLDARSLLPDPLLPGVDAALESLQTNALLSRSEYESLKKQYSFPGLPLHPDAVEFRDDVGGVVNLKSDTGLVILEFWSTHCTFCDRNIVEALQYSRENAASVRLPRIYIIPTVEPSRFRAAFDVEFPSNTSVAYDGQRIARSCRVVFYPVTIVTRGGRQLLRYEGWYGEFGFEGMIKKYLR